MESSKAVGGYLSVERVFRNKFLLLTVALAVGVALYIAVGLVKLLG